MNTRTLSILSLALAASFSSAQYTYDVAFNEAAIRPYIGGFSASFSSSSPALAQDGTVAVGFSYFAGDDADSAPFYRGIYSQTPSGTGNAVTYLTDFMDEPTFNRSGQIGYSVRSGTSTQGVYLYTPGSAPTKLPLGSGFADVRSASVNDNGVVVFQGLRTLGWTLNAYNPSTGTLVTRAITDDNFTNAAYSFLRTNVQNQFAYMVADDTSASVNQLRLMNADGTTTAVATASRTVTTFDLSNISNSSVALADDGSVYYIATARATGKQAIYRYAGGTSTLLLEEGTNGVRTLDAFKLSVNASGQIAFRAKDAANVSGVYVLSGASLAQVAAQGTGQYATDLGLVTFSSLGGSVSLNDAGSVAFNASLTSGTGQQLGRSVVVAAPVPEPASLVALGAGVAVFLRRRRRSK